MNKFFAGIALILVIGVPVALGVGYIMNIVKFANLDFQKPVKAEVLRGVGIAVPAIGMIEGYVNIKD